MKPLKETKLGKLLGSKGLDTVLDTVGAFVPGVKVLDIIKDAVINDPKMLEADKTIILTEVSSMLELIKMQNEDTANARNRELEIVKSGKSNLTQNILAYLSAAMFVFMVVWVLIKGLGTMTNEESLIIGTIIGAVINQYQNIHSYMFGSSQGSKEKTAMIKKLTNDNQS